MNTCWKLLFTMIFFCCALPMFAGPARHIRLTYTVPPGVYGASGGAFYFPVPIKKTLAQEATYEVSGAQTWEEVVSEDATLLRIVPIPNSVVRVTIHAVRKATIVPGRSRPAGTTPYPPSILYFLDSWPQLNHRIQEIEGPARELKGETSAAPLASYSQWTGEHVKAVIVNGNWQFWPTLSQILSHGTGQCEQQASVLLALCRAGGFPARLAFGVGAVRSVTPDKPRMYADGHTWVDVYLPAQGWTPLEQCAPDSLGRSPAGRLDYGYLPLPGYLARSEGWGIGIPRNQTAEGYLPGLLPFLAKSATPQRDLLLLKAHRLMHDAITVAGFPAWEESEVADQRLSADARTTPAAVQAQLEGTQWRWPGMMGWFRLKTGGSVENKWNGGRGRWHVNSDASVTLTFDDKGASYRFHFTKDLRSFHAAGIENTEVIDDERIE